MREGREDLMMDNVQEDMLSLEAVVKLLWQHDIDAQHHFTAAAGGDYGYVCAWVLPDGRFLVLCEHFEHSSFAVSDHVDYLEKYLFHPDLLDEVAIAHTANVLGADQIGTAAIDDLGPFVVLRTRHYDVDEDDMEGREYSDCAGEDLPGGAIKFRSYLEAQAWIDRAPASKLDNDNDVPLTYKIVELP